MFKFILNFPNELKLINEIINFIVLVFFFFFFFFEKFIELVISYKKPIFVGYINNCMWCFKNSLTIYTFNSNIFKENKTKMYILTMVLSCTLLITIKYNLSVYKHIEPSLIQSITEPLSTRNLSASLIRLVNEWINEVAITNNFTALLH